MPNNVILPDHLPETPDEVKALHAVQTLMQKKITKDILGAAQLMGIAEARYLVDTYYQMQRFRIASANQERSLTQAAEPCAVIDWVQAQMMFIENQIKLALDKWTANQPMGQWARNIVGIGPVLSAGLLANIDITRAPTVGHIWRFAGLDPTRKWEKNTKRPWDASLKRLCWLIGESFVKVSGHKNDMYGHLYLQRKEYEAAKNEKLEYAPLAAERLRKFSSKLDPSLRALYQSGKLPPKALHERSKRWAVKLFLAHWHAEAYRLHFKAEPPKPYPIAHLGHAHEIVAR
jgi:hypothetical protein